MDQLDHVSATAGALDWHARAKDGASEAVTNQALNCQWRDSVATEPMGRWHERKIHSLCTAVFPNLLFGLCAC